MTASHELSQEYREFERTSTVAANAFIGPRVKDYLDETNTFLEEASFPGKFLIVQSNGGLYDSDQARRECIRMLESGPAAGVIGTRELCAAIGLDNAIAFDMGGTTAKAGVILKGKELTAGQVMVGGYNEGLPIQIPMIDIEEVGTGGGSIARVETGAAMRVGPQSAGAVPGPVCYGNGGTEPTITDANVVLGRLTPELFLGGEMHLDVAGATKAIKSEDRRSAQAQRHRSGRRHRAHRDDADGQRGEARDHRARARCARFRDGRLWRRGPAARHAGRARTEDRPRHHPGGTGTFLGLRHAGH